MKKFLLMMMAMFIVTGIYAQDEKPIKIITNHPDFKVKVKRCVASDKTVIVDLILNNEGTNDVEKAGLVLGMRPTMTRVISTKTRKLESV